jgi:hypothetical protein
MNDKQLKRGLLQLAQEGWFATRITDEFVESMLGQPVEPASGELKEQFLSRFRVRIQDALLRRSEKTGGLDYTPSVDIEGIRSDRGKSERENLKRRKNGR